MTQIQTITNPVRKHLTQPEGKYIRYSIKTKRAPDHFPMPSRFRVRVNRFKLAKLLLKEIIHYRFKWDVILSRPCMYGVFSGPIGGFAPRQEMCVGCLRCTIQYPDMVTIQQNPARGTIGDSYFTQVYTDTVHYESQTGTVPVRGAGFRGKFGGSGWDSMWTDMSEIVRPTRDGIHGREFISTAIDVGGAPPFLLPNSGEDGLGSNHHKTFSLPLPILFDLLPETLLTPSMVNSLVRSAEEIQTLVILPWKIVRDLKRLHSYIAPLITLNDDLTQIPPSFTPLMVEVNSLQDDFFQKVKVRFPNSVLAVRIPFSDFTSNSQQLLKESGVNVIHLVADFHGENNDGRFILDLVREVHKTYVTSKQRDSITLIGSGGIIAAEHVAKAIICGLDAIALDTSIAIALQCSMNGECKDRNNAIFLLKEFDTYWGIQRLKNLISSWRDQLLEVLGAMGIREVRRLRGEVGRAMFQSDLEKEAFGEIDGFTNGT